MNKVLFFCFFFIFSFNVSAYTDLSEHHDNYKAILYLSEEKIFNGYDDGSFQSENFINRAEFLKILILAFVSEDISNYIESNFFDVKLSDWHAKYILYAFDKGWVDGYSDGYFRPESNINLVEALKLISMVTDTIPEKNPYFRDLMHNDLIDEWYMEYVYNAHLRDVITGDGNFDFYFKYTGGKQLNLNSYLTRGQAAELIYRFHYLIQQKRFCFVPSDAQWQVFNNEDWGLYFKYLPGWQLVYGNATNFSVPVLVDDVEYLVNADVQNLSFFDEFVLKDFDTNITTVPNLFFLETALVDYDLVEIFDESEFNDVKIHYWQDGDRFYLMTMYFDNLCGLFERIVDNV